MNEAGFKPWWTLWGKARRTSVIGAAALIATAGAGITGVATQASAANGPIFTVMNTSETLPDGVWFRRTPHTADTDRVTGHGVYKNEGVQLECYGWGDAVGPYANRLWYFVLNVTRPTNAGVTNQGYLNAHYINDGKLANQIDAGVPKCGTSPTPTPTPTYINGVNVGYPQNSPHSWGSNCIVQDFKGGPYGWVIVGYSNGTNIVRNGMLWGWLDNGGGPGLGCPVNQEHSYSDGVRQDFTHGSLYWASGMNHAQKVTWTNTWSPLWSGYVGTSSSVTYVHASWTVPTVNCASVNGASYLSIWSGIDGFGANDLVQAGSGSDCSNQSAQPSYYIWWEKIPDVHARQNVLPVVVLPGDFVSVDISYGVNNQYSISVTVNGIKQKPILGSLPGKHASAECIVEAPEVNNVGSALADFGPSESFSSCDMAKQGVGPFPLISAASNGTKLWRVDMRRTSTSPLRATPGLPRTSNGPWSVIRRAS